MENKEQVHSLNVLLANCFVLYVKLHRYHWYVQGKRFFRLHDVFEEMYDQFAGILDEVAERILMINGKPYATMEKFLKYTTLEEATADDEESEMISQLLHDYEQVITLLKEEIIPLTTEEADEPTLDMV